MAGQKYWQGVRTAIADLYNHDRWMLATYGFLLLYGLSLLLFVSFPEDTVGMGDTVGYLIFHPGRTLGFGVGG